MEIKKVKNKKVLLLSFSIFLVIILLNVKVYAGLPNSISLNKNKITLKTHSSGGSISYSTSLEYRGTIVVTSSNPNVASGYVNYRKNTIEIAVGQAGKATLTIKLGYGKYDPWTSCEVTVEEAFPQKISFVRTDVRLYRRSDMYLYYSLNSNYYGTINATSSNPNVVAFIGNIDVAHNRVKIYAGNPGTSTITIKLDNGKQSKCTVTVVDNNNIHFTKQEYITTYGENISLYYSTDMPVYGSVKEYVRTDIMGFDCIPSRNEIVIYPEKIGSSIVEVGLDNGKKAQCKVTINKANINKATISLKITSFEYTGNVICPTPTVKFKNEKLVYNIDYELSYKNNINVTQKEGYIKNAEIIVKGKGKFTGSKIVYFTITPINIKDRTTVNLEKDEFIYDNGKAIKPKVKNVVYDKNGYRLRLKYPDDYTITYKNNTSIGTAIVQITGIGKYSGTVTKYFKIKADISKAKCDFSSSTFTYNANKQELKVRVKMGNKVLVINNDYTISYKNNINVGTATATISGKGNYYGKKDITYKIKPVHLSYTELTLSTYRYEYRGENLEIKPTPIVKYSNITLKENKDYTVRYIDNKFVTNNAWIEIRGIGNYYGTKKQKFNIYEKDISKNTYILINGKNPEKEKIEFKTSGAVFSSKITVYFKNTNQKLNEDDYTKEYKGAKNGKITVTVKGKGNYKGTTQAICYLKEGKLEEPTKTIPSSSYSSTIQGKKAKEFKRIGENHSLRNYIIGKEKNYLSTPYIYNYITEDKKFYKMGNDFQTNYNGNYGFGVCFFSEPYKCWTYPDNIPEGMDLYTVNGSYLEENVKRFKDRGYDVEINQKYYVSKIPVDVVDEIECEIFDTDRKTIINKASEYGVNLTDNQIDALTDISYQYGGTDGGIENVLSTLSQGGEVSFYTAEGFYDQGYRGERRWILYSEGRYLDEEGKEIVVSGENDTNATSKADLIISKAKEIKKDIAINGYEYCVCGDRSGCEHKYDNHACGLTLNYKDSQKIGEEGYHNTCCATFVSWVLIEAGIIPQSEGDNTADLTKIRNTGRFTIINNNNITANTIKKGDILIYNYFSDDDNNGIDDFTYDHTEIAARDGATNGKAFVYSAGSYDVIHNKSEGSESSCRVKDILMILRVKE